MIVPEIEDLSSPRSLNAQLAACFFCRLAQRHVVRNAATTRASWRRASRRAGSLKQASEVSLHERVALTGGMFQSCEVADDDVLVLVIDKPGTMKTADGQCDRRASDSQHRGQYFLCQRKFVSADAISDLEEAPRAPFLDGVQGIARN